MAKRDAKSDQPTAALPIGPPIHMRRSRYEFVLRAEQPIAHHAESLGNEAFIMRRRIRTANGWANVPEITGDTMRHGMREAAAYALLDAAGLLSHADLGEAALRLLFAGGMVTGRGDASAVKLDQYRELCELVPSMALFGGCADNRVVPGRLIVESATLICTETTSFVPTWALDEARESTLELDTHRAHVEEVQRVRMDPVLIPEKRLLLSSDAQVSVNRRLEASEKAHTEEDAPGREEAKSAMLPRRFERIAQGSLFYWACEATTYTPLDQDTFEVAVWGFLANARVGGKRGTGHGLLRPIACGSRALPSPSDAVTMTALAPKVGEMFRAHVIERKDRLRDFLRSVNA